MNTVDLRRHANARYCYCDVIFVDHSCIRKLAECLSSLFTSVNFDFPLPYSRSRVNTNIHKSWDFHTSARENKQGRVCIANASHKRNGFSNHQQYDRTFISVFRLTTKETTKIPITALYALFLVGASNMERVSMFLRHPLNHVDSLLW